MDEGAIEVEQTGQVVGEGGSLYLVVVAAFGQLDGVNDDVAALSSEALQGLVQGVTLFTAPRMEP